MKPKIKSVNIKTRWDTPIDELHANRPSGWLLVEMEDGTWWTTNAECFYTEWEEYEGIACAIFIENMELSDVTNEVEIPGAKRVWMGNLLRI